MTPILPEVRMGSPTTSFHTASVSERTSVCLGPLAEFMLSLRRTRGEEGDRHLDTAESRALTPALSPDGAGVGTRAATMS